MLHKKFNRSNLVINQYTITCMRLKMLVAFCVMVSLKFDSNFYSAGMMDEMKDSIFLIKVHVFVQLFTACMEVSKQFLSNPKM